MNSFNSMFQDFSCYNAIIWLNSRITPPLGSIDLEPKQNAAAGEKQKLSQLSIQYQNGHIHINQPCWEVWEKASTYGGLSSPNHLWAKGKCFQETSCQLQYGYFLLPSSAVHAWVASAHNLSKTGHALSVFSAFVTLCGSCINSKDSNRKPR